MTLQDLKNTVNSPYIARSLPTGVNVAPQPLSTNTRQIKDWEEFCRLNNIFHRYRTGSLDTLRIPPNKDGEAFREKGMRFVNRPKSLILQGKAGRGKTHFMFALIKEMFLSKNLRLCDIRYFDHVDLDRRLQEEFSKYKSSRGLIEQLCDCPILVLDDFGIDTGTQRHERDFYEVFNKRFGMNYITIISTNLDEEAIYKAYGERITSRFKDAAVIEFNGPDLRGQDDQ